MPRAGKRESGFTLIELLTVIAIISILAAITMTVAPRVLERAKIGAVEADLKQMSTVLAAYYIDSDTFPPDLYDVLKGKDLDINPDTDEQTPSDLFYMKRLNLGSQKDAAFYDKASQPRRPFVYVPVYSKNVDVVDRFLRNQGDIAQYTQYMAMYSAIEDNLISSLRLPSDAVPPRFDLWVLLSTGTRDPDQLYGGLNPAMWIERDTNIDLTDNDGVPDTDELDRMRMYRLTAYVLATLDKDDNGYLDYDFRTRSKQLGPRLEDGQFEPLPNGGNREGPIIAMGP